MTGNPKCPLCNGKGTVTHWEKSRARSPRAGIARKIPGSGDTKKSKGGYRPVPNYPCFCARRRCGLCNEVVTTAKEIGSLLCNACAKAIANSTNLELEEKK